MSQDKTAEEKLEETEKKYLYLYAEFENFRKRMDKDRSEFAKFGHERLMRDLLTLQDNFERAITYSKEPDAKAGLEMISIQFGKILESYGVVTVKAIGEKFDPNFHDALTEEECDKEKGTVTQEVERGYLLHNRLLRAAKVIVAK